MFNVRGKKILVANAPKCSSGGSLVMGRLECALSLEAARSAASVFRKDRVADIYSRHLAAVNGERNTWETLTL